MRLIMNIYSAYIFILIFYQIYSFLIVSMNVKSVDDCIKSINLDNKNIYMRNNNNCDCRDESKNEDIEERIIPYEIGQTINFIIYDIGGDCHLGVEVKVNDRDISTYERRNFWNCIGCNNGIDIKNLRKMKCFAMIMKLLYTKLTRVKINDILLLNLILK